MAGEARATSDGRLCENPPTRHPELDPGSITVGQEAATRRPQWQAGTFAQSDGTISDNTSTAGRNVIVESQNYILALDQGTTSSRAILFNHQAQVLAVAQNPFRQIYPQPGWVEHDPQDILSSEFSALTEVLVAAGVAPAQIAAIGITNQRETTIIWDRKSGEPIANAIVWQCRRTADAVAELTHNAEISARITALTGLIPDAYFSASKIKWLLDNIPGARARAERGELAFGTVDSWLIWQLTGGAIHATDATNASRTMLFDIHQARWDEWLCELFDVPLALLPEVRPSSADFGVTAHPNIPAGIPICGVAGDQQAALFGQCCFDAGTAKNTYGTGCFLLMHTGHEACASKSRLLTTVVASAPLNKADAGVKAVAGAEASSNLVSEATASSNIVAASKPTSALPPLEYALEGSVFVAGALIQWLRDELGLLQTASESEAVAGQVADTGGVHVVPAFTGLGAPWWDAQARGAITGLTRGTTRAHLVRAALEALAYQVDDLLQAMQADTGLALRELKADGGAAVNNFLLQFQSDISDITVVRPPSTEATALGAAFLAGLSSGFWRDKDELKALSAAAAGALKAQSAQIFRPSLSAEKRIELRQSWAEAVERVLV